MSGSTCSSAATSRPHASSAAAPAAGWYSASSARSANAPEAPRSWPGTGGLRVCLNDRQVIRPSPANQVIVTPRMGCSVHHLALGVPLVQPHATGADDDPPAEP